LPPMRRRKMTPSQIKRVLAAATTEEVATVKLSYT